MRKHGTHTYLEPELKPVEMVQTIRTNTNEFDYGDEDTKTFTATLSIDCGFEVTPPPYPRYFEQYSFEFTSEDQNIFIRSAELIGRIGADLVMEIIKDNNFTTVVHDDGSPENMLTPHIIIHFAFNRRMNRMFIEFTFDHFLTSMLVAIGKYDEYMNELIDRLDRSYFEEITKCKAAILNPISNSANKGNYCTSDVLTFGTISYWKGLKGKYEFLNDFREVNNDFDKYRIAATSTKQFYTKIEEFHREIQNINANLLNHTITVKDAFKTYADFYNAEFDTEIKKLEDTEIKRFDFDENYYEYGDRRDYDYGNISDPLGDLYAVSHDYGDEDAVGDPLDDTNHFNYLDLSDKNTDVNTEMHGFGDEDEYAATGHYSDEGYIEGADFNFDELAYHPDIIPYPDAQSEDYIDEFESLFTDQDVIPFEGLEYVKNTSPEEQHEFPIYRYRETLFYVDFENLSYDNF